MKQLIVMISMIMLGIAIAGMVGQFSDSASQLATETITQIESLETIFEGGSGGGAGGGEG